LYDLDVNVRLKSAKLNENIEFMRWIDERVLGIVSSGFVYHWTLEGDSQPVNIFARLPQLAGHGITNYRTDSKKEWCLVVGFFLYTF
jgi:clathrin heavy chain